MGGSHTTHGTIEENLDEIGGALARQLRATHELTAQLGEINVREVESAIDAVSEHVSDGEAALCSIANQLRMMRLDQLSGIGATMKGLEVRLAQIEAGLIQMKNPELGPTTVISLVAAILTASLTPDERKAGASIEQIVMAAEKLVGCVWERSGKNQREREHFEELITKAGLAKAEPAP